MAEQISCWKREVTESPLLSVSLWFFLIDSVFNHSPLAIQTLSHAFFHGTFVHSLCIGPLFFLFTHPFYLPFTTISHSHHLSTSLFTPPSLLYSLPPLSRWWQINSPGSFNYSLFRNVMGASKILSFQLIRIQRGVIWTAVDMSIDFYNRHILPCRKPRCCW